MDRPAQYRTISPEVPEEVKPEFREAVIQAVLEKTLQPDGTCFETFRRIHGKEGKLRRM